MEQQWLIEQVLSDETRYYFGVKNKDGVIVKKLPRLKKAVAEEFKQQNPDFIIQQFGAGIDTKRKVQQKKTKEKRIMQIEQMEEEVREGNMTSTGFKPCGKGRCRNQSNNRCRNLEFNEYKISKDIDNCNILPLNTTYPDLTSLEDLTLTYNILLTTDNQCFTNSKKNLLKLFKILERANNDLYSQNIRELSQKFSEIIGSASTEYNKPYVIKPVNPFDINSINLDCIGNSKERLKPHQIRPIAYLTTNRALLIAHATGTGKTLLAVAASQCFLSNAPNGKIIFVGPPGLIGNFKENLLKYGISESEWLLNYSFFSFDTFQNYDLVDDNVFLIIDEVHNLRNPNSIKSKAAVKNSYNAEKVLLLSATPFVNNFGDFIPIINMIHGQTVINEQLGRRLTYTGDVNSQEFKSNIRLLQQLLEKRVDFYENTDHDLYPDKIYTTVYIGMIDKYLEIYKNLLISKQYELSEIYEVLSGRESPQEDINKSMSIVYASPEKFYNGCRRLVNSLVKGNGLHADWYFYDYYISEKVKVALNIINKDRSKKSVIYSNWVEQGVLTFTKLLEGDDFFADKFGIIVGSTPLSERLDIVKKYNEGSILILVISKAGSEGLDLEETRNIIVLDPPWNQANLDQIIGRGIRYKSHINLPKEDQNVTVYMLLLMTKADREKLTGIPEKEVQAAMSGNVLSLEAEEKMEDNISMETVKSGDIILYNIIKKKRHISQLINLLFAYISIGSSYDNSKVDVLSLIFGLPPNRLQNSTIPQPSALSDTPQPSALSDTPNSSKLPSVSEKNNKIEQLLIIIAEKQQELLKATEEEALQLQAEIDSLQKDLSDLEN